MAFFTRPSDVVRSLVALSVFAPHFNPHDPDNFDWDRETTRSQR